MTTAVAALALLGSSACALGTGGGGGTTTGVVIGADGLAFATGAMGIGADGKVYREDEDATVQEVTIGGPVRPLAPRPLTVAEISQADLQTLYRKADELGLLDEPVTTEGIQPAMDEMGYTVRIGVDGRVIEHKGLGSAADDHSDRRRLHEFHAMLRDLDTTLGDGAVGADSPYKPHGWRVMSVGMGVTDDPRPWIHGTPPSRGECVTLASSTPLDTVSGIYRYHGKDYLVQPAFPWDDCMPVGSSS